VRSPRLIGSATFAYTNTNACQSNHSVTIDGRRIARPRPKNCLKSAQNPCFALATRRLPNPPQHPVPILRPAIAYLRSGHLTHGPPRRHANPSTSCTRSTGDAFVELGPVRSPHQHRWRPTAGSRPGDAIGSAVSPMPRELPPYRSTPTHSAKETHRDPPGVNAPRRSNARSRGDRVDHRPRTGFHGLFRRPPRARPRAVVRGSSPTGPTRAVRGKPERENPSRCGAHVDDLSLPATCSSAETQVTRTRDGMSTRHTTAPEKGNGQISARPDTADSGPAETCRDRKEQRRPRPIDPADNNPGPPRARHGHARNESQYGAGGRAGNAGFSNGPNRTRTCDLTLIRGAL
jgi:hypothetical protein